MVKPRTSGVRTHSVPPRRIALFASCITLVLGFAGSANAQGWLRDRSLTEGAGIRVGDVELHPGVGVEVGLDSNWFVRSHVDGPNIVNGAPNAPIREAGVFRLTPSIAFGTPRSRITDSDEPSFVYRGSLTGTYRELVGKEVNDQRDLNLHATFRGEIFPSRPLSGGFFAGYQRFVQPSAVPDISFNRSDVNAGAEIVAVPNSGTLSFQLGYQFYGAFYESSDGAPFTNLTNEVSSHTLWHFLPRFSIFTETGLGFVTYPNASRSTLALGDAIPFRTRAGVSRSASRFAVVGSVGYSTTFVAGGGARKSTSQYDGMNALLEGTMYLTGSASTNETSATVSTVTVGYTRDMVVGSAQSFRNQPTYTFSAGQNTTFGGFTGVDKFYGRFNTLFGDRASILVEGYFDILTIPSIGLDPDANPETFHTFSPAISVFGEYRVTKSFGVNATVDYVQNISSVQVPLGPTDVFDLNNRRLQALVGVRWPARSLQPRAANVMFNGGAGSTTDPRFQRATP